MNVVFFTHDLDNAGSQKVLVNLANGLVRQGYTVEIVAMLATGLLRSELDCDILVVDLHANAFTVVPRLVQYLRHRRPEVMLAFYNAFTLFPLVAQRISGVPVRVIPTVHTMVTNILQESPIPMLRLAYRLTLAVWRRAPIIVAVSETVATDLTKYHIPRDRVRVIYNPVLNREFDQRREELLEDSWIHAVNSNIPIVIGVGRLCHQKNFQALIRSFAIIRKQKGAKLVIVGDGPDHAELVQLVTQLRIQDDVHFAGHVNNPLPFMQRAHVLVLSSRYEGLGLVAVEALAVGTPVVGYANLPLKEIAVSSGMMHLVTPGDEAMLARSILETMSLKARKSLMVDLTSQFGEHAVVEQYAALLLSTKSGRGSHGTPDTKKAARNIVHGAQTNGS